MGVVHEGFVSAWMSAEAQNRTNNNRERKTRITFIYSMQKCG